MLFILPTLIIAKKLNISRNGAEDEMITLALKTILAMRKKGKTEVFIG